MALPSVTATGVAIQRFPNAAFRIPNSTTIDVGGDDFLVLVVADLHGIGIRSLFNKSDGDFQFPKGITLDWEFDPSTNDHWVLGKINDTVTRSNLPIEGGTTRLYGLRRVGDQAELRINGEIVNSPTTLLTPGASTENSLDANLGQLGVGDPAPLDEIHEAIIVRGVLSSKDVGLLESYLLQAFSL